MAESKPFQAFLQEKKDNVDKLCSYFLAKISVLTKWRSLGCYGTKYICKNISEINNRVEGNQELCQVQALILKKKVLKGIVYVYAKWIKIILFKWCLAEQREVYKFNRWITKYASVQVQINN